MKYNLFEEVVLIRDMPESGLRKGDVATVVDHHPVSGGEDGYTLEIFNALGDTVCLVTVAESEIQMLTREYMFTVRSIAAA